MARVPPLAAVRRERNFPTPTDTVAARNSKRGRAFQRDDNYNSKQTPPKAAAQARSGEG
ncbi:MAG: hypothetical protein HY259_15230 [Chloroflexi bacterium]|nr:hypothetical protein [Chloroflexota bacterium]